MGKCIKKSKDVHILFSRQQRLLFEKYINFKALTCHLRFAVTSLNHRLSLLIALSVITSHGMQPSPPQSPSQRERMSPGAVQGSLADHAVVAMAACPRFSLAVTSHGEVFTWGRNWIPQPDSGRHSGMSVGAHDGTSKAIITAAQPRRVADALMGHKVVQVACGREHWLALTQEGLVFSCR